MTWTKGSKVTAEPASEPLTTAQAKAWLKIETSVTDDDTLIDSLVSSARREIENKTGLALFTQTVTDVLDAWPDYEEVSNPHNAFFLMRYPVQSVTSITYYDTDGNEQTLNASKYIVDTTGTYCRIGLAAGETWPSLRNRINAVTVTYTAGWSAVASIPDDILTAMKLMLTYVYEKRADSVHRFKTMAEYIISHRYVHI